MTTTPYLVFYPYNADALTSETVSTFTTPAAIDPFPASGAALTNTSFFPVQLWSADVVQTLNIGSQSGGAGAGKITFNPFSVTRKVDAITPMLFVMSASGTPFKFIDLLLVRSGAKTSPTTTYLAYRFGLAAIETAKWGDSTTPTESLSFEYGSLTIGYAQLNPDGTYKTMTFQGWDRVRNVKL